VALDVPGVAARLDRAGDRIWLTRLPGAGERVDGRPFRIGPYEIRAFKF
jgi:hypothetical protein